MNPLDPRLVPAPHFEGKAFPMTDMVRYPIALDAGAMIFATNVGDAGTCLSVVNMTGGTVGHYTAPTLASGPTAGRAMKASMTLINTTQNLNRGGSVWQANLNQRIELPAAPSSMTLAQWNAVSAELRAHPETVECSANDFVHHPEKGGQPPLIAYPSDHTAYHAYESWKTAVTLDEYFSYFAMWPGSPYRNRPMSTLLYIIGPQTVTNNYTVSVRVSGYTRWPVDTVPGRQGRIVPTASPAAVSRLHTSAWSAAQAALAGVAVAGVAAGRTIATYAGEAAGAVAAEPILGMPLLAL